METSVNSRTKIKVIDSLWTLIIAIACLGPFALPLLWRNPRFSKSKKIWVSVVVCVLTLVLLWIAKIYIEPFLDEYQSLMAEPR